jgi:ADP-heptose:LPS heptosyltransferase
VLEVQAPLKKLAQLQFPQLPVITPQDTLPEDLTHATRLVDLLAWWGEGEKRAYLKATEMPPKIAELWETVQAPRIGLVWGGNPEHLNDANRSVALSALAPVLAPYEAQIISLQKGPQAAELATSGFGCQDGGALCDDFADTAALVAKLDLVISADTSVAHLAGGLGIPVWLLTPFDPDWRWQLQRRDTPWYSHMKLYRQQAPQDWAAPLAAIAEDLKKLLAGDASVLVPPPWDGAVATAPARPVSLEGQAR